VHKMLLQHNKEDLKIKKKDGNYTAPQTRGESLQEQLEDFGDRITNMFTETRCSD